MFVFSNTIFLRKDWFPKFTEQLHKISKISHLFFQTSKKNLKILTHQKIQNKIEHVFPFSV